MLEQRLDYKIKADKNRGGDNAFQNNTPRFILSNLRKGYGQRPYQLEAFGRFDAYFTSTKYRPHDAPSHVLFHMATGSGKTLVMAGAMLYLYEKGYRNFLFFVKSTNILEKTKDNFINPASPKYLFAERIEIGGREIKIRAVDNFQFGASEDINIAFTTTQGLYAALKKPRENGLTFDDFKDHKMVLIADEAHSLSAETKKGNGKAVNFDTVDNPDDVQSWEGAVKRIFNAHSQNILLDFTATANLEHPEIAKKYHDKLLFDYSLRQFRQDLYSKEVEILQVDDQPLQRALVAVLLSQYRLKLFGQYAQPIKPVVLFKTHKIEENKTFHAQFTAFIQKLKGDDLEKLNADNADPIIKTMFDYFAAHRITMSNLAAEIKMDFAEDKLLMVNDDKEAEKMQIALNTLEEAGNAYRGIFAVNKLDEGWDVLNLFDIVRVSHKRDAANALPVKTTVSEAQLIGRGARYCPFSLDIAKHGAAVFEELKEPQAIDKRKFDALTRHPLRVCETLYYHSLKDTKYIAELKKALDDIGIKDKNTPLSTQPKHSESQKTTATKKAEKQTPTDKNTAHGFANFGIPKDYPFSLRTGDSKSMRVYAEQTPSVSTEENRIIRPCKLYDDFGETIVRKAMHKLTAYRFDNLQRYFPSLQSSSEFMTSAAYLRPIRVLVKGNKADLDNLSADDKLYIAVSVLHQISCAFDEAVIK